MDGDDFDSLDLDGDLLDDDVDEISKFTEQTAITDVSTLAKGMAGGSETDDSDADVSPDILEEIMESSGARPPAAGAPIQGGSLPPVAGQDAMPTAVNLTPLQPLLESNGDSEMKALPPTPRHSSMTVALIVIGILVLAAGGFIAYGFLSVGEDGDKPASASPKVAANDSKPEPPSSPPKAETPVETPKAADVPTEPDQETETETAGAQGFPAHKCKSFAEYPSFAWRDRLDTLASAAGKSSLCELFGMTKEDAVTALQGTPNFGPTGYDLMPRSTVFELFPLGKAERRAPSMELLFLDDLLYEVRMKFGMSNADNLDPDMFKALLGAPKSVSGDPLNREIKIYTDEDMIIHWYKKTDAFKRVFNEVVFASRPIRGDLKKELKARSAAQIAFEQGMALYNQKQVMRAIDKFRKARKIVPAMGSAYIFEGIALLQNEQFDKIDAVAQKAFENSTDDRARAGAKGLQAVVALYNGDKDSALAFFKNANGLDPTDPEFSTSVEELKTGEYDPARTAKTAARMECRFDHPEWSVKGLLARGNFPDNATFLKAKRKFRKKPEYKKAFAMWNGWECR